MDFYIPPQNVPVTHVKKLPASEEDARKRDEKEKKNRGKDLARREKRYKPSVAGETLHLSCVRERERTERDFQPRSKGHTSDMGTLFTLWQFITI